MEFLVAFLIVVIVGIGLPYVMLDLPERRKAYQRIRQFEKNVNFAPVRKQKEIIHERE